MSESFISSNQRALDVLRKAKLTRYERGGGRLFVDGPSGARELVADFYNEDTRELIMSLIEDATRQPDETSERCHFRAFGQLPCEKPKGHDGDHTCQLPADHRSGTEPLSRVIADLEMAISPDLARSVADRFELVEKALRQLKSAEKASERPAPLAHGMRHCPTCGEELGEDGHHKPDPVPPLV